MTAVRIVVAGAHLSGQPLNHQLTDRSGRLIETTTTSEDYRLHALATTPPKPGLVRVTDGTGIGIEVEVWELEAADFATFVDGIPAPMVIGRVTLADGTDVAGFLCEPFALVDAPDISRFGGWRQYLASLPPPA